MGEHSVNGPLAAAGPAARGRLGQWNAGDVHGRAAAGGSLRQWHQHLHVAEGEEARLPVEHALVPVLVDLVGQRDDVALVEAQLPVVLRLEIIQRLAAWLVQGCWGCAGGGGKDGGWCSLGTRLPGLYRCAGQDSQAPPGPAVPSVPKKSHSLVLFPGLLGGNKGHEDGKGSMRGHHHARGRSGGCPVALG